MSLRALACHWRPWGWRGGCADETGGAARIIKSYQGWLSTMPLLLTEADVQELLPMEKALERVEASFLAQARGGAINRSPGRNFPKRCSLHHLAAALETRAGQRRGSRRALRRYRDHGDEFSRACRPGRMAPPRNACQCHRREHARPP